MSEWTRKETPVSPAKKRGTAKKVPSKAETAPEATPDIAPEIAVPSIADTPAPEPVAADEALATDNTADVTVHKDGSPRYSVRGTRRGQYRFAAFLGLLVILLAVVGLASLIVLSVRLVQKATDHTDLMNELTDFAAPIIEYKPEPFTTLEEADQSTLLLASIYRITDAERVRQLKERTEEYAFDTDDYGRLLISVKDVEASFAVLFGTDITPVHRTLGMGGGVAYTYEYDKPNACYHVPTSVSSSLYTTVVDDIEVSGKTASIRVGYALTAQLEIDDKGREVPPTADKMETYRWLTFTQTTTGWVLTGVREETPVTSPATGTTSGSGASTTVFTIATTTTTTTESTKTTTTEDTSAEGESDEDAA